jgi:hypothetical protein
VLSLQSTVEPPVGPSNRGSALHPKSARINQWSLPWRRIMFSLRQELNYLDEIRVSEVKTFLAISQYASGSSCELPSPHKFSWFPSVFKQTPIWFQNCHCTLLTQLSRFMFIKICHLSVEATKLLNVSRYNVKLTKQKIKIMPCHQCSFNYHPHISTLTLSKSGPADSAWEPPANKMLSPHQIWRLRNKLKPTWNWSHSTCSYLVLLRTWRMYLWNCVIKVQNSCFISSDHFHCGVFSLRCAQSNTNKAMYY